MTIYAAHTRPHPSHADPHAPPPDSHARPLDPHAPPPGPAPALAATGLRHRFGTKTVLAGVDISVADGEVVGLVGPNGSGKTTALRILHRAVVPDAGQVQLAGRDLAGYSGRERARLVAVMAQEAAGEVPLTVADVVLLGRIPHAGSFSSTSEADLQIATESLESAGALHLARQEFSTLSGGERQRVLVARALAQQPRVLLMDEPTNHLDIGSQHHVLEVVRARALATIVVLHDLNLAARYCDRVIVLDEGVVRADADPRQALAADLVGETYGVAAQRTTADDGTAQLLFRARHPSAAPSSCADRRAGTGTGAHRPTPPAEETSHAARP